jgi:predicted metal-binding membrane protein
MQAARTRAGVVGLLLLAAATAWALSAARMDGMDMGPVGHLGSLGWFTVTWALMMAAMMLPSVAPVVPPQVLREAVFVAGYLLTWSAAGLAAFGLIEAVRGFEPDFLAWDDAGRYVAGGVIAAAGLYQLTPLKDACLRRCRAPLAARRLRPGAGGALRSGVDYGVACIGCCWALMAALFALGAMSLIWMAVVAAIVAAEKLLPSRVTASRGVALLLLVLGLAVALAPGSLPGFTEPMGMHH